MFVAANVKQQFVEPVEYGYMRKLLSMITPENELEGV